MLRIWSPHVVLYYRKHFYSILTNLSNLSHSKSSIVPFAKFRSDLKNVLIKHFPTTQPFANVLQNRSSYKFHDIHKKISLQEPLFNKVTRLMAFNFIKNRLLHRCFPVNITKCLRKAFFIEHLWWLLLKMVEESLRISDSFEKYLYRRIHKSERFVKMLCSKWRHEIT